MLETCWKDVLNMARVLGLLGFLDIAGILMSPLQWEPLVLQAVLGARYLVNAYQTGFGLVVCILEAPPEWLPNNPKLEKAGLSKS